MKMEILKLDDTVAETLRAPRPRYDAHRLTRGGREAEITLDGKTYTLRITRQGKLLLTK